jgi:hypothetical protein
MKTPRRAARSGTLRQVLMYAPVVLEVLNLMRRAQSARRGKRGKARRRDRLIDGLLGHATRAVGGRGRRRGWF